MSCLFSFGSCSRSISDHFHPFFLCLNSNINIYIVDAGMREQPHHVPGIKIPSFHNFHAITFDPFQENKLVHSHFARDAGEKTQRQFDHWVKTNKATDAWIHFFDGKGGMSATESMHPTAGLNAVGHHFSSS